jgi:GNAT superfamily N-acetyltransferase
VVSLRCELSRTLVEPGTVPFDRLRVNGLVVQLTCAQGLYMNGMDFRPAIASDSVRIASLHTKSWRSSYRGILPDVYLDGEIAEERERHWRTRLLAPASDRRYVLLAETKTELVGFVCVFLDEEPAWGACLDNLHVSPELRGQGLGRRLFAKATRWVLEKEPASPIHLWVFEANQPAQRFYERFEGEVVEREMKELPGRAKVSSLRYVWRDPRILLSNLTRSIGRG